MSDDSGVKLKIYAMIKTIILHEIRQHIFSLRLQLIFITIFLLFILGSIAYIFQYRFSTSDYNTYSAKAREELLNGRNRGLINTGERNVTTIAVDFQNYILPPLKNGFIDDSKSQYIPNTIQFNAFNVFSYSVSRRSGNPYLPLSQELNWYFIISLILSFAILLLSFDSVSGEKQSQTLSLILSNRVPRSLLLLGKYLSIIITSFLMILPGIIVALIILLLSGTIRFDSNLVMEIGITCAVEILFIACIAALGIFCSVVARSANVSLLLCLGMWLMFLIFSPNLAVFSAENLFRIKNSETIETEIKTVQDAINKDAPEGSWSMSGDNLFYPQHELRAKNQTNLFNAEKQIKDRWYNTQFEQYKNATRFTYISPISLLGLITEAITGNGYPRFQNNWNDFHTFQSGFLTWFKAIDANDQKSPHWYNPYEDCSTTRLPIKSDELPVFTEKIMPISLRLTKAVPGILLLLVYSFLLFGITAVRFNRYDVR
jgi:ABC-type transport system involved in multi-copper enzyme maturation permease subunit